MQFFDQADFDTGWPPGSDDNQNNRRVHASHAAGIEGDIRFSRFRAVPFIHPFPQES